MQACFLFLCIVIDLVFSVFSVYFFITCCSTAHIHKELWYSVTPFFINQHCTSQHWTIKNGFRIHTTAIWAAEARLLDQTTWVSLWSPHTSISLDHHDPVMVNHCYFLELLLTEIHHYRHGNTLKSSRFGDAMTQPSQHGPCQISNPCASPIFHTPNINFEGRNADMFLAHYIPRTMMGRSPMFTSLIYSHKMDTISQCAFSSKILYLLFPDIPPYFISVVECVAILFWLPKSNLWPFVCLFICVSNTVTKCAKRRHCQNSYLFCARLWSVGSNRRV